jgi:putative membrane protein
MVMPISSEEKVQISDAIRRAEQKTSGEIVCVVARSSSDYGYVPLVWSTLIALATPWPLIELTSMAVLRIFLIQLVAFAVSALLLSIPRLRMWLVPRAVKRQRAHRAAMDQFLVRGMAHTREHTGVLIFASIAERYARVIADAGIAEKVPPQSWRRAVDCIVANAQKGRIADGLVEAVDICATTLAGPFPRRADDTNELPDRVYVI